VSLYYVFEYNPYKPIFMNYNFYFKYLRNMKQILIRQFGVGGRVMPRV
jgi:hypothetical protein